METVKITFGDGTEITAEVNGSCYIVDDKFNDPDLSEVTIGDTVIENATLMEAASVDGRYWFTITRLTEEELMRKSVVKQRADIDYIAMVSDIDLEEG